LERHQIRFVASLTVDSASIRRLVERLNNVQTRHNPLAYILTTPLFAGPKALAAIRDFHDRGHSIMFDSGGYYCQTGRIDYTTLYGRLLKTYWEHRWADIYVLPDNVPRSQDHPDIVTQKVCITYEQSCNFFYAMPDELKERAMPVVHGHNYRQIDSCLEAYIKLGVKQIGFGSFGTLGKKSQVNVATSSAIDYARYTIQVAHSYGMKVHTFGMGVPAVTMMLHGIKADSFDSSSWLKAAGFGQVFLPLMRAYNISHRNSISELQKGITFGDFRHYCEISGHSCPLCASIEGLQESKMQRAAHNLIVLAETVEMLNTGNLERVPNIYRYSSQRYQKEFDKWLLSN
jgi:hypothetical protein